MEPAAGVCGLLFVFKPDFEFAIFTDGTDAVAEEGGDPFCLVCGKERSAI
jgi:hypothetical protein